ncbi:AAEL005840-PA [Aedes aegypti]|uniref:AAEL005840-PA n=1 Tax=Aedes aegypti TaxID=7159 RepID=Q178M3_AEDAE|nr:AAEL005840-PA [Aedes aegypti]
MGQLKIVSGGIQLTGQAMVLDILRASSIRSKHGQPISIESSRNFSVNTRDSEGYLENQLFLGHDRLEVLANHFRVADTHGTSLFSVDRDEVTVGASSLRVEGEGGVIFRDFIQTPLVRAEAGKDLKLESPTRSLEARATQEIFMQSRAGSIEANCLNDLKLHSVAGSIRLDASTIIMPNLRTAQAPSASSSGSSRDHSSGSSSTSTSSSSSHSKIYQLCACSNGKLFLAPAHSICTADDSAICR